MACTNGTYRETFAGSYATVCTWHDPYAQGPLAAVRLQHLLTQQTTEVTNNKRTTMNLFKHTLIQYKVLYVNQAGYWSIAITRGTFTAGLTILITIGVPLDKPNAKNT